MAWTPNGANAELNAGINHVTNSGHENTNSVTLDGGLQRDSDRWNGLTPHAVLTTALGASSQDDSWEQYQREEGGYRPGSMEQTQDQLDQGNDNLQ